MKKSNEKEDKELLKTVAQAWLGHSGNHRLSREWDAQPSCHRHRPTRFKLEAERLAIKEAIPRWDFGQSLWDSYEIVTLCNKLERGAVLDDQTMELGRQAGKRRRETKSGNLRNLLEKISSKRFDVKIAEANDYNPES